MPLNSPKSKTEAHLLAFTGFRLIKIMYNWYTVGPGH